MGRIYLRAAEGSGAEHAGARRRDDGIPGETGDGRRGERVVLEDDTVHVMISWRVHS